MENTTISGLPSASTPLSGTEVVPVVQSGTTKKVAVSYIGSIAAGSDTQVQYNSSNAFAGSANLTFNGTTLTANTLNLTNALGTTYGGTGLTSYTANGVVYASSTSALATSSALTWSGTTFNARGASNSTITTGATGNRGSASNVGAFTMVAPNASGTSVTWGGIRSFAGSAAAGSESSLMYFSNMQAGTYTDAMVINTSGNVGIGLSSPSYKLDVSGTARISGDAIFSGGTANGVTYLNGSNVLTSGSALTFDGSAFWVAASSVSSDSLNVNGFRFGSGTFKQQFSAGFDFQQYYTAAGQANPQASIFVDTAAWGVKINSSEQMRLTSTGLGIGTSSAVDGAKLSVYGNYAAFADGTYKGYVGRASDLSTSGAASDLAVRSTNKLWLVAGSSGASSAVLDSSGNLGLGVTPSAWTASVNALQLQTGAFYSYASGTTSNFYMLTNAYFNGTNNIYKASNYATQYLQSAGQHIFYTAPSGTAGNAITFTQAMTLDASGNLGVGTTTPGARFQAQGVGSTSATYCVSFVNSGGFPLLDARNDGLITTGSRASSPYNNTSASAANMYVDSSGILYRSTSALKYKQDVRDLEAIDVNRIRPVRYKSKCKNDDQTKDYFGVIADEVDAAGIKELVSYGVDGEVEGFQYERLTVVLLKAIQEQQAVIQSLTDRIAQLEAK
jgi:hypothetical protein